MADAAVRRAVDLAAWMARKSHFLLGPRQTGKSHLVRNALPDARVFDLLDSSVYLSPARTPRASPRNCCQRIVSS